MCFHFSGEKEAEIYFNILEEIFKRKYFHFYCATLNDNIVE